ncbi:MAG TPA: PQQ-dependent sugar dehydrogenase [Terriglobales bacterium]|jgi:glucose/arabinose dehydrogenase
MEKFMRRGYRWIGFIVIVSFIGAAGYYGWTRQLPGLFVKLMLHRVKLPSGFTIQAYATHVPNARSMALSPSGIVFVGSRRAGKVYALVDRDHTNKADVITIAHNLDLPNGVAFRDGALYVAEATRILRYDRIEEQLSNPPAPVVVNADFPNNRDDHDWKYIRFGPDGWLYVPVGAPCNICEPKDERYATIQRMRPDGTGLEIFARGIRNSVGFDWSSQNKELWFTENGRDWMGDDIPPDELNHAPHAGMHFGYPYCHGKDISDWEFGNKHACSEFTPPALELPAHVAALGMCFYHGGMFPAAYDNQIFIAERGSWNRRTPTGDRISLITMKDEHPISYEVFADGWLIGPVKWGRLVDVLVMPDGALLVSDERAGAIYRITYKKQ